MKKNLFAWLCVFSLIAALCLTACGKDDAADKSTDAGATANGAVDLWKDVEGDEIQAKVTIPGGTVTVVLNRNGDGYISTQQGDNLSGDDFNRPELDAEMGMYATMYGTYEIKDGECVATLASQIYYRFVAWGKDADALLDACFEANFTEKDKEAYYGKGIIRSEEKGTTVLCCSYEDDTYAAKSLTTYDENKVKISESIVNADGSYTSTDYHANGTAADVCDYDKDDNLIKKSVYTESGALEYVETVAYEEGKSVTTRTDANGKVIRTEERKSKKLENGGHYAENTVTENGVVIYRNVIEEKVGADGDAISSYNSLEEVTGNRAVHNVNYIDHKNATNNYTFSEEYVDDVLTYYFCAIEKVTVIEGASGRQNVTYTADTGKYILNVECVDANGGLTGQGWDYMPDEYVHGAWETFEYVPG